MKKQIDVFNYAGQICKAMKKGILLTTKRGEQVNTMTIGWGTLGVEWRKPVFTAFVRESRFTKEFLDDTKEFTVNIPLDEQAGPILSLCGTKSGRDVDKFQALGLHQEAPEVIAVPGIKELPLTLECRVLYRQKQEAAAMPGEVVDRYYPQCEEGTPEDDMRDLHTLYIAEIVSAYIIEE